MLSQTTDNNNVEQGLSTLENIETELLELLRKIQAFDKEYSKIITTIKNILFDPFMGADARKALYSTKHCDKFLNYYRKLNNFNNRFVSLQTRAKQSPSENINIIIQEIDELLIPATGNV